MQRRTSEKRSFSTEAHPSAIRRRPYDPILQWRECWNERKDGGHASMLQKRRTSAVSWNSLSTRRPCSCWHAFSWLFEQRRSIVLPISKLFKKFSSVIACVYCVRSGQGLGLWTEHWTTFLVRQFCDNPEPHFSFQLCSSLLGRYPPITYYWTGLLILDQSLSRWELDKFKNCWNKSFRASRILTLLYQQFSNLLISQRDMSGPRLGALSNRGLYSPSLGHVRSISWTKWSVMVTYG